MTDSTQLPSVELENDDIGQRPMKKEPSVTSPILEMRPVPLGAGPSTAEVTIEKPKEFTIPVIRINDDGFFARNFKRISTDTVSSLESIKTPKLFLSKLFKTLCLPMKFAHDLSQNNCPTLTPVIFGITCTFVLFLCMYIYKF